MTAAKALNNSKTRQLRLVGGFALNQAFLFSLFYFGENQAFELGSVQFERVDLFVFLVCMATTFWCLARLSDSARDALLSRTLVPFFALLAVLGSVAVFMTPYTQVANLVEGVLVGVPSALLLAAWARAFVRQTIQGLLITLFASGALAVLVCFAFNGLPGIASSVAEKTLPLISVVLLLEFLPRRKTQSDLLDATFSLGDVFVEKDKGEEASQLSLRMLWGTVLFGCAAGFIETYSSEPGMFSNPSFMLTLIVLFLFCLGALRFLMASDSSTSQPILLDVVYRLSVLVMVAGALFVPVLSSVGTSGESVILAGYLGLTFVLMSLFIIMSKITGCAVELSFARGFIALYVGEMLGIVFGNVFEQFGMETTLPYIAVALSGLVCLYAFLFLFTDNDFRMLSVMVEPVDRFDQTCEQIAEAFALSPREAEILRYALRGRTGERIASELCISKSTVETHLRRIYQKTGTHGRQELIDLGESYLRD